MRVKEQTKDSVTFKSFLERFPGGVNSPVRAFTGLGIDPLIIKKGQGDSFIDSKGNTYIDYCMSWGALLLGHAHQEVVSKATERLKDGSSFGLNTLEESYLAERISSVMPSIEKIRFVSSGTEATMTAVRLARGVSGRSIIVKFDGNYHGHSDLFLTRSGSGTLFTSQDSFSSGVPKEVVAQTLSLPYNDVDAVRALLKDPKYASKIAAVIVEPIAANMGVVPATPDFIQSLFELTQKTGSLLIFDEVISGFRLGLNGAQGLFNVRPDLTCLGKIVGGGLPAAALGGRKDVMDFLAPKGDVYQAGTLAGNPLAMQAGLTTLECVLKDPDFYAKLTAKASVITDPVSAALKQKQLPACIQQVGGMFTLFWGLKKVDSFDNLKGLNKVIFAKFFRFLLERGVYISPSPFEACFVSMAHTENHLKKTRDLILEFIKRC